MSSSLLLGHGQSCLLSVAVGQSEYMTGPLSCRLKQLATGPEKALGWIQIPHHFNLNSHLLKVNQGIVCVHTKSGFIRSEKENQLLHSPVNTWPLLNIC